MKPQVIPFGEWLPDLPAHAHEGALVAKNVIPEFDSYRHLNSLSAFSTALGDACLGAFWTRDDSGNLYNFCGDVDTLYELQGTITWTDVSRASPAYSAANWEFAKFGQQVIAVNIGDTPQFWNLGSSTAFDDLANAPNAARVGVVRDFLVLGDVDGLGVSYLQWSGYRDSTAWTPSIATQSDQRELTGRAGRIQRIVPGQYGLVFCENSIYRMDYVGPSIIFNLNEVERRRGTPAPNSVIWSGANAWYYSNDGFYHFDGRQSTPISANRVIRWFHNEAAADALDTMRGALDRINRLIIWSFRTSSSLDYNDRLLIFNWAAPPSGRWSYAEVDTQVIDEYVTAGLSLDDLDTPLPGGIDSDSIPVDSSEFQGGSLGLQVFDTANKSATFSGSPLVAQLDTKEIGGADGRRIITRSVEPLVEASPTTDITVQVGTRDTLQGNAEFTMAKSLNGFNGEADVLTNAEYNRYRLNISGGFEQAKGVRIHGRGSGARG